MGRRMDGQMNRWMGGWMGEWVDRQVDGWMMDRWMGGWMDGGWVGERMDNYTNTPQRTSMFLVTSMTIWEKAKHSRHYWSNKTAAPWLHPWKQQWWVPPVDRDPAGR